MRTYFIGIAMLAATQPAVSQETVTIPREAFSSLAIKAGQGCMTKAYSELLASAGMKAGLEPLSVMGMALSEYPAVSDKDGDEETLRRNEVLLMFLLPTELNRLFDKPDDERSTIADLITCRDEVRGIIQNVMPDRN